MGPRPKGKRRKRVIKPREKSTLQISNGRGRKRGGGVGGGTQCAVDRSFDCQRRAVKRKAVKTPRFYFLSFLG